MDSVTQLTFGAAIGYAVAGREHGWKAAAAGAICGTLPDLDILVSYDDPITEYVEHRGFTHSLFWLTLATPPIALFLSRIFRIGVTLSWALGMWLALVTHPVLDAFTIYGTKLWLPFSSEPVLWSTLFIIDPLYTVPLIIAVVMALRRSRAGFHSRAPLWALWISSAYLAWSVAAKAVVSERIEATLAQKGVPYTQYVSTPVVYGTFFWRALAMTPDGYYEGYIWLLEDGVQWNKRSSRTDLIPALEQSETFRKLQWFSRGFYRVRVQDGQVLASDLRMGDQDTLIFRFVVGDMGPDGVVPRPVPERVDVDRLDFDLLPDTDTPADTPAGETEAPETPETR